MPVEDDDHRWVIDTCSLSHPALLALALCLKKAGHPVTVVTEDRRDKGGKLSVVTACGLLRVYALPLAAFLRRFELIPL